MKNATWVYEYDRGGNITSKKKYAYTTGTLGSVQQTIPYVYGDSSWKDKLTSYNGQTITYDAIGNPLSDGTWSYTWQAGRQLKKMTKSGMTVEFQYDHNGMRTQKKVTQNGVITITNYTLHGKLATHMTVSSDKLHFFYDAQSRPAKVNFNGAVYTYLHNLQGDIAGIVDNGGNLVVEYKYNAWGKLLATIGTYATTLGKLNPFRYRGYIYDEETGMYWLQNRYYCPEWHKFIIADLKIGSRGRINSYNAYNYCYANPVKCMDPSGFDAIDVNGSCGGFCYPRVRANFVTWRQVPSYMRKKALASVSTFNRKVNKTRDAFEKYTSISGSVGYGIGGSICAGKFVDVSLHLFKATVGMEYNDSYFSHSEKRNMPYELKYGSNLVLLEGSYSVLFFDMVSGCAYKTYIEHTECGDGTVSVREYDSVRDGRSFDESNIGNFNLGVSGYLGIGGEISLNVDRA